MVPHSSSCPHPVQGSEPTFLQESRLYNPTLSSKHYNISEGLSLFPCLLLALENSEALENTEVPRRQASRPQHCQLHKHTLAVSRKEGNASLFL